MNYGRITDAFDRPKPPSFSASDSVMYRNSDVVFDGCSSVASPSQCSVASYWFRQTGICVHYNGSSNAHCYRASSLPHILVQRRDRWAGGQ